jgi:hypothetical protein
VLQTLRHHRLAEPLATLLIRAHCAFTLLSRPLAPSSWMLSDAGIFKKRASFFEIKQKKSQFFEIKRVSSGFQPLR